MPGALCFWCDKIQCACVALFGPAALYFGRTVASVDLNREGYLYVWWNCVFGCSILMRDGRSRPNMSRHEAGFDGGGGGRGLVSACDQRLQVIET